MTPARFATAATRRHPVRPWTVRQLIEVVQVLFLAWRDNLHYKLNASAPTYLSLRPNDSVVWNGIRFGKSQDYSYLDFGLSDWDQEGLVRYKRKFATEEETIRFLRYSPNRTPSEGEKQLKGLLSQMTDLFTDDSVPDSDTEKAGDVLYQYFC